MTISGEVVEENATVIWLQVDQWFADIRTFPRSSGKKNYAFAGKVDWDSPRLSFYHQLNTMGVDENDSADFEFKDSFCVERGHLFVGGIKRAFEETWSIETSSVPCKASLRYDFSKLRSIRVDHEKESIVVEKDCAVHVSMTSDSPVLISRVGQTDRVHSLLESLSKPCWDIVEEVDTNY